MILLERFSRPKQQPETNTLVSSLSTLDQIRSTPPEGEGILLTKKTAAELEPLFEGVIKNRFKSREVKRLLALYEMMTEQHSGQKRRTGAEFAVHPARVAIRDALDSQVTPLQLAIDLGHDFMEDCDLTSTDVYDLYRLKDYTEGEARSITSGIMLQSRMIAEGDMLSNSSGIRRKNEETYLSDLLIHQPFQPIIQPIYRKRGDSVDNVYDDWYRLEHERETPEDGKPLDPQKILNYLAGKASNVVALIEVHNMRYPKQPAIDSSKLVNAINGCFRSCERRFPEETTTFVARQ